MVACQIAVDAFVQLAIGAIAGIQGQEAAVVLGQLLLDNIGFDGHAEMIGLSRQVSGDVIILTIHLEALVAQIAPENGPHPKLVSQREGFGNLDQLAV